MHPCIHSLLFPDICLDFQQIDVNTALVRNLNIISSGTSTQAAYHLQSKSWIMDTLVFFEWTFSFVDLEGENNTDLEDFFSPGDLLSVLSWITLAHLQAE